MALNLKEKRFYQDQVESGLEALDKKGLPIKEKRAAQDQVLDALEKLGGDKAGKTLYQRLVDGEFNNLPYMQYYEKLKKAWEEKGAPLADAPLEAIKYLEAHYDPATDSMTQVA